MTRVLLRHAGEDVIVGEGSDPHIVIAHQDLEARWRDVLAGPNTMGFFMTHEAKAQFHWPSDAWVMVVDLEGYERLFDQPWFVPIDEGPDDTSDRDLDDEARVTAARSAAVNWPAVLPDIELTKRLLSAPTTTTNVNVHTPSLALTKEQINRVTQLINDEVSKLPKLWY